MISKDLFLGADIAVGEFRGVADVGSAKGVDGLIVIGDSEDAACPARHLAEYAVLDRVGVLVFVDEKIADLLLHVFLDLAK